MGGNDLDLRHAELDGGELTINAVAVMGGQDIYLPEGVEVQVDGFALIGDSDQHGGSAPPQPGARRCPPPGARDQRRSPLAALVTDRAISQHHRGHDRQDAHRLQRAGRLAEHEQPHH